jgi:glycosyltransferase involved in cell wall biosynthesis
MSTPTAEVARAITVLAGARDQFQIPLALAEVDLLEKLITDAYWPMDRAWFRTTAGRIIPSEILASRFQPGLPSEFVRLDPRAALASLGTRLSRRSSMIRYKDRRLGRAARDAAARHNVPLLSYSYYASEAFKEGPGRPERRLLFQLHPDPRSVRSLLQEELELSPSARDSLRREHELALSEKAFLELSSEPHLANGWIAASSYTAQTLAEHGIPVDRIAVVPYGVDTSAFPLRTCRFDHQQPFTVIFVGSLIQRKGLTYLLEAVRQISSPRVRVLLCGRGFIDEQLLAEYRDVPFELRVGLPLPDLVHALHESDLFVLPSLAEGFGHVILEAMSAGLPVIATRNSAAPDLIIGGREGFIVPIRSAEAIAERLEWALDNRETVAEMGILAAATARKFNWEAFRTKIRLAYTEFIGRTIC